MKSHITFIIALASSVSAHTILQQISINGVAQERYKYMRLPSYNGPITDVGSSSMACNGQPNPLVRISNEVASVKAGDQITLHWAHTLDTNVETGGLVIDASHKGPVMAYMAKVSSATGAIPKDGWFKIYEDGLSNGVWAVDKLIQNKGKVTVTIPSCVAPGDYLLRGELIALHGAGSPGGAQLYMECAQLRVTSGGSGNPSTVSFPGTYGASDPGITINIYQSLSTYQIPGPRPFTCSGGSDPAPSPSSTAAPSSTPASSPAPTSTAPASGTVGQWGQCGGIGYTGSGCQSQWRCVVINDYYHQCQ